MLWRTGLLVFLVVLLLSIPQAALMPLLDRDEPRFAEASREMVESGNLIVPTFNHAPRYAKPPLLYWCQALSYKVFGEHAFAARLPSLLATAGTALLLFVWGAQFGYKSIGLIAAFLVCVLPPDGAAGARGDRGCVADFFHDVDGVCGMEPGSDWPRQGVS